MPDSVFAFILRQSLEALPLTALVAVCDYLWRSRAAGFMQFLWSLVLIKLVFPAHLVAGWLGTNTPPLLQMPLPAITDEIFYTLEPTTAAVPESLPFLSWAAGLWLAIAGLLCTLQIARYLRVRRLVRNSSNVLPASLYRRLDIWQRRLGIRRSISFRISDQTRSAFYYGLRRPIIVLPQGYEKLSLNTLDAVIGHECVHIARYDNQRLFVYALLRSVFWFNPLVWWAVSRLQLLAEQIADQGVLRQSGLPPLLYGQWLIAVSRNRLEPAIPFSSFSMQKNFLRLRIQSLIRRKPVNRMLIFSLLALALILSAYTPVPLSAEQANTGGETEFTSPLPSARITSTFGMRMHPIKKKRLMHNGIDLAAPKGTPVLAVADGQVIFAEQKGAYGKLIIIRHQNGYTSRYGQLSEITVQKGSAVKSGQQIGAVGSSGMSTAPHLHFELRVNSEPLDPQLKIAFK